MKFSTPRLLVGVVLMLVSVQSFGTHLRAGEIIVERVNCTDLTFRITVKVFTDTESGIRFGGYEDWLDFGDGERMLVPETPSTPRPELGPKVGSASFTVTHTFPGYGSYVISYLEPMRNENVVNMDGSVNTRFYVETKIILDPYMGCSNMPQLLVAPIDGACTGALWSHNAGAYDPDQRDSLSYELVVPFRDVNTPVFNYRDPNAREFYVNYEDAREEGGGPPTFAIDPLDGTITWNAPGMAGEYNIAFVVHEWRKVDGVWRRTGHVRRDMQVIVEDCDNNRPDLIVPTEICVEAGTTIDETIFGIDSDSDPVKIEAFSEIFHFAPAQSPATYTPKNGAFVPSVPPAELKFQWNTTCDHVREQPYQVVFKITDNSPGPNLTSYKTWSIRVVGPAPQWQDVQVNLATRTANLEWESYVCQNAAVIQVWRRVDSFEFTPDSCQTGIPEFLGYQLIKSLPVKDANNVPVTRYSDNNDGMGLASGAEYCYRLVALYPAPRLGESYVSEEICLPPILADAPIITNVSVTKTSTNDGNIYVRWTKPFEIDRTQFPGPYQYEVYRANGFAGATGPIKVNTGRLAENDTVFTDVGMNTLDNVYNYRVVLYSNTSQDLATYSAIDTSAIASTVRIEAEAEVGQINVTWTAFTPWSNLILTEPNQHDLYRAIGSDVAEQNLVLYQSIDPTTAGLSFLDTGLDNTKRYCYRVMTRGSYGNPGITEPLENFSQLVCAIPSDTTRPCTPTLIVELTNCETFLATQNCEVSNFSNTLKWIRPEGECAEDIKGYKIYRASEKDGVYTLLANAGINGIVTDTFYIDNGVNNAGLSTMAYCYKISSIDRSNNESHLSDAVCNDNCPYYELPNVFTPNDLNSCNALFGAWRPSEYYLNPVGENGVSDWKCGEVEKKCARFVKAVNLKVYNRWGKEVYSYRSSGEQTIYIDWNGSAEDGTELAAGVYYYAVEVTFNVIDPAKKNQVMKGWVHLIR
jgi:hypothetical protein